MVRIRSKFLVLNSIIFLSVFLFLVFNLTKKEELVVINYNDNFVEYFNIPDHSKNYSYFNFIDDVKEDFYAKAEKELSLKGFSNEVVLFKWAFKDEKIIKDRSEEINKYNIELLVKNEVSKYRKYIRNDELHIYIFPSADQTMGYTISDNIIILYINCSLNQVEFENQISWTLAHEYTHSYFYNSYLKETELTESPITTLLDDMIFEGKAISFANYMYEDYKMVFGINDSEYKWDYYKQFIKDENYCAYSTNMSSVGINLIPRYDVYVYGYLIVENYIHENNIINVKEWLDVSSDKYYDFVLMNEQFFY